MPIPSRLTGVATSGHGVETNDWVLLSPRLAPPDTLAGHLTLALKREGVDLAILRALIDAVPRASFEVIVREKPHGLYARRLWFLIEWLSGQTLDLPDSTPKRSIVDVLDPEQQLGVDRGEVSTRHRVRNNLPGTPAFCPLVRLTPSLVRARGLDLGTRARVVINRTPADLLARAAAFLQLMDSKASFAIEQERVPVNRAARWAQAIARAGRSDLSVGSLELLQQVVVGDARLVKLGLRNEGGFVGEHDRDTGEPLPDHISARHQDLRDLLAGLQRFDERVGALGFDPVVAAAISAFGFVYIHPFEDGNGRLHRWVIHHVLAATGFAPHGVVLPVSAVMLRLIDDYRNVLESYSKRLLPLVEWRPTAQGNVDVLNETAPYYRYFDATAHAEFLYRCIEETISRDLPHEVAWLEAYDRFAAGVQEIVDMPARTVDLLHRFLRQHGGRLSERAKEREFQVLGADEVTRIEALFREVAPRQETPT